MDWILHGFQLLIGAFLAYWLLGFLLFVGIIGLVLVFFVVHYTQYKIRFAIKRHKKAKRDNQ